MKKHLSFILSLFFCMMIVAACGKNETADNMTNADSENSREELSVQAEQKNDKPAVQIRIIDDKHATFLVDCDDYDEIKFSDIDLIKIELPSNCLLDYNRLVDGVLFACEDKYIGRVSTENTDSTIQFDIEISTEEPDYMDCANAFSFGDMNGDIHLKISNENGMPFEYDYSWDEVADMNNYHSSDNTIYIDQSNDHSKELVGIWATDEFEGAEDTNGELQGYLSRRFYVFYSDGTWSYVRITDSRDTQNLYHSVDDNFTDWYAKNKPTSNYTYYYDGETIVFMPENNQNLNKTEASLNGQTLNINMDYGRYLDEDNMQSGTYHYYEIGEGTDNTAQNYIGDPASVSLSDFVGEYRGISPYFITDWDTYEMSEDVDHSSLTINLTTDGCEFTNFVLDSDKPINRHEVLDSITLKESDMRYVLDDGQEDLWDTLEVDSKYGLIILAKRQRDGQLMVAIDFGGSPQVYIPK